MKELSDEEYKLACSLFPRFCVDLLVRRDGDGFILTRRLIQPQAGLFHFPGGRVFHSESIVDAISRIAHTELGFGIKDYQLIDMCEFLNDGPSTHSISAVYWCEPEEGDFIGSNQGKEYRVIKTPEDLTETHPIHKEFILNHWNEIKTRMNS